MIRRALSIAALMLAAPPAAAQGPDVIALQNQQREAMAAFARMDGVWRGSAWSLVPGGGRHEITQTERIGTFLNGTIRVVEGRGYNQDGSVGFNAFGVISYNPRTSGYTMTSWAQGRNGAFDIRPTADGYVWETPAGPGAVIRYTATINGDSFREVGHRVAGEAPPVQIFEMNLRRIGPTDWPTGAPVPMR